MVPARCPEDSVGVQGVTGSGISLSRLSGALRDGAVLHGALLAIANVQWRCRCAAFTPGGGVALRRPRPPMRRCADACIHRVPVRSSASCAVFLIWASTRACNQHRNTLVTLHYTLLGRSERHPNAYLTIDDLPVMDTLIEEHRGPMADIAEVIAAPAEMSTAIVQPLLHRIVELLYVLPGAIPDSGGIVLGGLLTKTWNAMASSLIMSVSRRSGYEDRLVLALMAALPAIAQGAQFDVLTYCYYHGAARWRLLQGDFWTWYTSHRVSSVTITHLNPSCGRGTFMDVGYESLPPLWGNELTRMIGSERMKILYGARTTAFVADARSPIELSEIMTDDGPMSLIMNSWADRTRW